MDGQQMFEYLSKLTEEQRKAVIVDNFWYPDVIDEVLGEYETAFKDEEAKILCALSDEEKMKIVQDAHDIALASDRRSENDEREIKALIIVEMNKWLKEYKPQNYGVTLSFLCHATVQVKAKDADHAAKLALQMLDHGKITTDSFKDDDQWPDSVEIDEVYNMDTETTEQSTFGYGEQPKQRNNN